MKKLLVTILIVALALGLVGCKSISEKIGEEVGEEIAGGALGGDVEVDGDSVTIETDDGAATITGDTGEIPEGFPDDFPLYSGYKVESSSSIESNGEKQYYVNLISEDGVSEIYDWYKSELTGDGWNLTTDLLMTSDGEETGMLVGEKDDGVVTVTLAPSDGKTSIGLIVVVK